VKVWGLMHSREGTSVTLTEVPFWALAAQHVADTVEGWHLPGFCLLNPPGWMWNIHWGAPDSDDYYPHSLGSVVWDFANALLGGFGAYKREKELASIPVSYEWVREHVPGADGPWDGSWEDGEDEAAGQDDADHSCS
jgi:hypothetical protein